MRLSRYVALMPLAALCLFQGLLLSWLAITNQLATTRLSMAVAFMVLATGLVPALIRPAQLTMLAGWIAVLLASVILAPVELSTFPVFARQAPLALPGSILIRLVCCALLGPAFLQFTALLLNQHQLSGYRIGLSIATGLFLAAATLLLPYPLAPIVAAALVLWFAGLTGLAIWRLIRARTDQTRLLLATILVAELPLLLRLALATVGISLPYELILGTQLVLPIGIGYAILRHDLFGIDAILRRALTYTLLSVTVLALYFAVTAILTALLAWMLPQARGLAVVVGLFVAAIAFAPLRDRVQQLIDQALYPERIAFRHALRAARKQLAQVVQRTEVHELLQHQLPTQLGAIQARLILVNMAEGAEIAGNLGWSTQLQAGETIIGRYWIGPRHSGLPYDPEEQLQLLELSRQAALALAYTDALEQLRSLNQNLELRVMVQVEQMLAQQRILAVADERQRLARELHDSVTQTLFSMNLGARAIRGLIPPEAQAAQQALIEQEHAARQALAEMRELLSQLRAPISEHTEQNTYSDLVAELQGQCAEFGRRAELVVNLDAPEIALLPATLATELAQISREALTNVRKHSGSRVANVVLTWTATTLLLCITDQGCGFVTTDVTGERYGLRGMRERAAAFGGVLDVVSSTGQGTMVRVSIQEPNANSRVRMTPE